MLKENQKSLCLTTFSCTCFIYVRNVRARLSSLDLYTIAVHLFHQKYYRDAAYWVKSSILSYEADRLNEFLGCDRTKMLILSAEILIHLSKYLKSNVVYIN